MTKREMNKRIANRFKHQRHFTTERMSHWPVSECEVRIATANMRHVFARRNSSVTFRRQARQVVQKLRHLKEASK